jgi:hypothetical protein
MTEPVSTSRTLSRFKKVTGWVLIIIGFLALVTPLTPGGILLLIGLELIGIRILFLERLLRRKTAPIPKE